MRSYTKTIIVMKEYRTAKGWAILIYIFAPLMIGLMLLCLVMPFFPETENDISPDAYWILAPILLGGIALFVGALLETIKGRFVIDVDNSKVYSTGAFTNRELLFSEIRGYRVVDKYIIIEPSIESKKEIKIGTHLSKSNEIIEWLSSQYPDLDVLNAILEEQEILSNEEFGWTTKNARKTSIILNWAGGIVGAWVLFWTDPTAVIASIIVPLISIIALKLSRGLIRTDEVKGTAYPTIFWALFAPSLGLCLRALFDYNIFDYSNLWIPLTTITLLLIVVILLGNKEFKFKKAKDYLAILGISVFGLAYGYGTIVSLNCVYDKSEPVFYTSKIISKRISSGKSTTYYFELTPWGPQKETEEVSVSRTLYNNHEVGNQVTIYFKKGQFEIPWFVVTD